MSPSSPAALPLIDVAPFLKPELYDDDRRASAAAAIHSACLDYGFFYLNISAYVDPAEPERLTQLGREFFNLPQEEKDKLSLANEDSARGYARLKENVTNGKADNHEGIDFYRPVEKPDRTRPLWGENQWPTMPGFKASFGEWIEKMKTLGLVVMEAMAMGLGMTPAEWEELRAQVDNGFWSMRVIGYPPLPNDHDGFSCGAHKDYGCLTFLHADPTPDALQVFSRGADVGADTTGLPLEQGSEQGSWINADPIPGCVVCNIGEMWEVWTNGLYRSTLHRVVHRGSNYRIPFFFEPNYNARVRPLDAALRIQSHATAEEAKTERKSVVYGEFLLAKVGNNFAGGKGKYD